MFHEKRPCAPVHAARYASASTMSHAGNGRPSMSRTAWRGPVRRTPPRSPASARPVTSSGGASGSALHSSASSRKPFSPSPRITASAPAAR